MHIMQPSIKNTNIWLDNATIDAPKIQIAIINYIYDCLESLTNNSYSWIHVVPSLDLWLATNLVYFFCVIVIINEIFPLTKKAPLVLERSTDLND